MLGDRWVRVVCEIKDESGKSSGGNIFFHRNRPTKTLTH
jgi:hypothetical protein